ncbi:RpiB/LacA/LacB family sugar-phosphate isomerase [Schlesneria paludicola]|uniref:RpiB/LacA/LacB family sugar-phosphate isomerase n=1 Tax=Schlesneria paludicola TaxID=360056 RepID=UPI0012FA96DC|nr:RpiB/LacA/LacB family sugar-phosphate isomerase [Schlesneria paludicola]
MTVNQALIDEIVTNVLTQLQRGSVRRAPVESKPVVAPSSSSNSVAPVSSVSTGLSSPVPVRMPSASVLASTTGIPAVDAKPAAVEVLATIITADVLEKSVRSGQTLRVGRRSILTPSARDWLNSRRIVWSRQDRSAEAGASGAGRVKWHVILQTVTPTVKALQDGIRRLAEGWKIELVGQPLEAATMATSLVSTAECDGVVIFTEQAELIACKANRHDRVRAAVIDNAKQWEHVVRTLSANVVCISPIGKSFIELRNLLRDCGGTKPRSPADM